MFKFNENYNDLKQVEKFYSDFDKINKGLEGQGKFAYNSLFKDKIKGIKGEDESIAIYLLQHLKTQNRKKRKIKNQ